MQVKVFEADDMTSGLKLVKDTFGPDALILSTKTIRNGKLGLRGKPRLEITAAIDKTWDVQPEPVFQRPVKSKPSPQPVGSNDITYEELWKQKAPYNLPHPEKEEANESNELKQEIAELKNTLNGLTRQVSTIQSKKVLRRPSAAPEYTDELSTPGEQDYHTYSQYGLTRSSASILKKKIREYDQVGSTMDDLDEYSKIRAAITQLLSTKKVLNQNIKGQKCLSLIGPTGVGKTTTIAKLAANYLNKFGGKIALITIDTYRIAAVEQLKVYGEIMRLPVEIVIKPSDLTRALEKFREYDLILIDTAGRSPKNSDDIREMADFLLPHPSIEHHLLLSAVSREQEIFETINSFSILPFSSTIFSKIDECNQLGVILNTHIKMQTPISFLTNGQRVPEDIIAATPNRIAELIVNNQRVMHDG